MHFTQAQIDHYYGHMGTCPGCSSVWSTAPDHKSRAIQHQPNCALVVQFVVDDYDLDDEIAR